MSRYRKIEVRTWSDEKFRALSAIPPSGKGLWFFLLTGPHTTAIPGLFRAGRAAMAEELDWELEAFDEAFREVSEQGMAKADFKAKLVWLPKAVRHNKPESPNVVRGWRVELDLLPECALKREAIEGIREALREVGPSYVEAFDELFYSSQKAQAKPSRKASGKASLNQEQEQEQEQEERDAGAPAAPAKPSRASRGEKTLKTYIDECKAAGVKPIPDDHYVRTYLRDAGITEDMAALAWLRFREDHTIGTRKGKRYTDWPAAFANSVKDRWYRLWLVNPEGAANWTNEGLQARRVADAQQREAEVAA